MVAFLRAALSNRRTLRRAASFARIASFKSSSIRFCNAMGSAGSLPASSGSLPELNFVDKLPTNAG
jgi:hypothetical protein